MKAESAAENVVRSNESLAAPKLISDVPAGWYLDEALAEIPRVLTLEDRDPSSPTYGCFDRNYWHYRTQDFPSGMYQELALPLAQVYSMDLPGNRWRGERRLRDLAIAGVCYAARSAHADGSCDDYYPYERALGATAFAASACAQALLLLNERDQDLLSFVKRRSRWLLNRQESGRLSNHQALVALAAARTAALTNDKTLLQGAHERLRLCLAWQHQEGWFSEYEGADPGYQTLTISFLAALKKYFVSEDLDAALARAVIFSTHFLHPDDSYGGETGSRNTCQVLPSGFERLASCLPEATYLADGWLAGASSGRRGYPDDDRIFCHWLHDVIEAYRLRVGRGAATPSSWRPSQGRTSFEGAGLHVVRDGKLHLVIATTKGGAFRAYSGRRLLRNDTGLVGVTHNGARLVSHIVDRDAEVTWENRAVTIRGRFHYASKKLAAPMKQVAFRLVNCTAGRLAPDLVRRVLQRSLITGKQPAPLAFERRIDWSQEGAVTVRDRILAEGARTPSLVHLYGSTDATSIYVATSQIWQEASLGIWEDLTSPAETLRITGSCEVTRIYS
jgi:hypothetical protein